MQKLCNPEPLKGTYRHIKHHVHHPSPLRHVASLRRLEPLCDGSPSCDGGQRTGNLRKEKRLRLLGSLACG
ncbi:MAG: hypothetical protein FWH27_14170 [Planctomycetaceae bacterium]|nr:hypothetical protein [Planctomycetaceae bacterium]